MRITYADPGLHGAAGHHPNVCRDIVHELKFRRIPARVLGFTAVESNLQKELEAAPFFRHNLYWLDDGDPLAGPLYGFFAGAQAMRQDLGRLGDVSPDDVIFFPWMLAGQFWGALMWLNDLPPERLPLVVGNFLHVPDVRYEIKDKQVQLGLPDYRVEPSAMFLRFAAKQISDAAAKRLRVGYSNKDGVDVLRAILGMPVEKFPSPQHAVGPLRRRGERKPLTVGMLGHQRGYAKGVQFMPDLVRDLLSSHLDVGVVIHNGANDLVPEIERALSSLASSEPRFLFQQGAVDPAGWAGLLERIDLIVCPYSREEYRLGTSGIHNEAIANAIPAIVPAGTTLAATAEEFGGGMVFGPGEPKSILDATRRALDNFTALSDAALKAATKWRAVNGAGKLVDHIVAMAAQQV